MFNSPVNNIAPNEYHNALQQGIDRRVTPGCSVHCTDFHSSQGGKMSGFIHTMAIISIVLFFTCNYKLFPFLILLIYQGQSIEI